MKKFIIEHQSARLSFSIINLGRFLPKRNHIKISFENIDYHILCDKAQLTHWQFQRLYLPFLPFSFLVVEECLAATAAK